MSKLVIDVSQFQGTVNWEKIAPQIDAALIRLGYRGYGASGTLCLDPTYTQNMAGAIAHGVPVGVYWCSQATSDAEAEEEAAYCIENLKGYTLQYPVWLDSERMGPNGTGRADKIGKQRRTQYGLTWARAMQTAGYKVGLYCSESWFTAEIDGSRFDTEGFDIWIAKYASTAPAYRHDAWQFTSSARMDGINANVDQSHFYKDYDATKPAPEPDAISVTLGNGQADIGLDANYWGKVLRGQTTASAQNIKFLMDKYHMALLTPQETVHNAVEEIEMDSPSYWLDVLMGKKTASAANVKALMDKYHEALTEK